MQRRDGLLSFMFGITNGQVFCRHFNHLHTQIADLLPEEQDTDEWTYFEPEEQTPSGKNVFRTNYFSSYNFMYGKFEACMNEIVTHGVRKSVLYSLIPCIQGSM